MAETLSPMQALAGLDRLAGVSMLQMSSQTACTTTETGKA